MLVGRRAAAPQIPAGNWWSPAGPAPLHPRCPRNRRHSRPTAAACICGAVAGWQMGWSGFEWEGRQRTDYHRQGVAPPSTRLLLAGTQASTTELPAASCPAPSAGQPPAAHPKALTMAAPSSTSAPQRSCSVCSAQPLGSQLPNQLQKGEGERHRRHVSSTPWQGVARTALASEAVGAAQLHATNFHSWQVALLLSLAVQAACSPNKSPRTVPQ